MVLLLIPLLLWGQDTLGPTVDEPFHLIRGLAWWWTDSTRLSYAHPPVANALQALPAVWTSAPVDLTTLEGWSDANHAHMAQQLVMTRYDQARPWLWSGRLVTMALMILLAVGTYLWTSRRLGAWTGLVTLALLAFNPTVLAHAQLFTTDLPVALALAAVAATFVDMLAPRRPATWRPWLNLVLFAVAMGAALGTKFTAVAMIPLLGGIGVFAAVRGWGRYAGPTLGWRLLRVAGEMVFVAGVSLVILGALYRFEEVGLTVGEILAHPEPRCHLTEDFDGTFLEQRWLTASLPRWLPIPLPYSWWFGFEMVRHHGSIGHPTWFAGLTYGRFNPAYFPVLLLIKNPAPWLVGLGALTFLQVRARRWLALPLAVPTVMGIAMLLLLMASNLNIGVRHALPVIVLLTPTAAAGLVRLGRAFLHAGGVARRVAAAALVLVLPAVAITHAGHYLGYFNIGRLGYAISVIGEDWGQDTIRLARVVEAHDMEPVRYLSYGMGGFAELLHQGVEPQVARCGQEYPPWGWLVMHRATVVRWPSCTDSVDNRPPDLVINDHLYAWDLSAPH